MSARAAPKAYADPYLAGVGLGLVLLASFVLAGRGLGASGAFATAAAASVHAVAPDAVTGNTFLAEHLGTGGPLRDWLVVEILGVIVGGFVSAALAGRLALRMERGAHASLRQRLGAAVAGGVLMGGGAVLARGCTSGQALTGGALLSVGAWVFIGGAFAAAYLVGYATRRSWT
ncbi:MAG: YeeE/YedE thiosulfate transporter family protein [Gemmatimonadaceae bacterium]